MTTQHSNRDLGKHAAISGAGARTAARWAPDPGNIAGVAKGPHAKREITRRLGRAAVGVRRHRPPRLHSHRSAVAL